MHRLSCEFLIGFVKQHIDQQKDTFPTQANAKRGLPVRQRSCSVVGRKEKLARTFHPAAETTSHEERESRSSLSSLYGLTAEFFVGSDQSAVGPASGRRIRIYRSFF
jgi:hypothetical protein